MPWLRAQIDSFCAFPLRKLVSFGFIVLRSFLVKWVRKSLSNFQTGNVIFRLFFSCRITSNVETLRISAIPANHVYTGEKVSYTFSIRFEINVVLLSSDPEKEEIILRLLSPPSPLTTFTFPSARLSRRKISHTCAKYIIYINDFQLLPGYFTKHSGRGGSSVVCFIYKIYHSLSL